MRPMLVLFAVAFVVLFANWARAAEKAKPVVCASYEVLKPGIALCSDNKRPFLMRSFSEVTVTGPDGAVKVLVGWR